MNTATKTRKRRQATPEQKAAAAEKRDKIRAFCKQVADMSHEAREEMAKRLPLINTTGHPLSRTNCILIMMQGGGGATVVGGFNKWLSAGRCVAKGQHGYSIWVPVGKKSTDQETGETSTEKTGFVLGTVFDISQTVEIEKGGAA